MSEYVATIRWQRGEQKFIDDKYSRGHQWEFDGGVTVSASASPSIVPLPMSIAENVDPEEAFVAYFFYRSRPNVILYPMNTLMRQSAI